MNPLGSKSQKYVDRNLNKGITKTPTSQQGKLLVLQNTSKTRMIKSSVGVSAAPTPTNTGSLKNETKGKESFGQMTPVGSVWSHSVADKSLERSGDNQSSQDSKAAASLSKPAPWAKSNQAEGETVEPPSEMLSTRESIKTSSWAVDSDDEDEEGIVSAPPPTYANPAALVQASSSPNVSMAAPLRSEPPPPVPQQPQYPYSGGGNAQGPQSSGRFESWGSSNAPPARDGTGYGSRQWLQGQQVHDNGRQGVESYQARGPRFGSGQDAPQQYRQSQGGGYPQDTRFGSGGNRFNQAQAQAPDTLRKPTSDWSSRANDRVPGMPVLKPMVHSSAQLSGQGGSGHGPSSSHGQSSFSTEGMTEEQRALEEARLEREQLEQRKRQEEQAKRDAEEREQRAKEAARLHEERERERARIERERQLAAYDAHQRRPPAFQGPPPQNSGLSDRGDRWQRAAPPPVPTPVAHQSAPHTHARVPHNMAPPRGPPDYGHHGQSQYPHPTHVQGRPTHPSARPYGAPPHQQGPAGMPPRQVQQQPYASMDHHQDEAPASKQPNPTRILQHPPQHKMLFDPKSGSMVEPGSRDRGMSESSAGSTDKKDSTWRKSVPYSTTGPSAAESAAAAAADDARRKERERKVQEQRAAELEEQRVKEEKQNAMREARAKEAAERDPRTQGVLYCYNDKGDLVRVLTQAEKAEAAVREESRRLEKELARERALEREKKKAALASKRATRDERLTADALKARAGESVDEGSVTAAQIHMDEYVLDEQLLEQLDINSDDVLQESIEFVEVKSRRSIAQEKKEKETSPPPPPAATSSSLSGGAKISPASFAARDVRGPKQTKTKDTRDALRKDDGQTPEVAGPADSQRSSPAPITLAPPVKPAWQAARSTLVDIGAISESDKHASEPEVSAVDSVDESRASKELKDKERLEKQRLKAEKFKEIKAEKEKARKEALLARKGNREREPRAGRRRGEEEDSGAGPSKAADRSGSSHAHMSFDTSAVTKHLLGKDNGGRASVNSRDKEDSAVGDSDPHTNDQQQQLQDEHGDNYLDLSGLGLESMSQPPDILQAFRNEGAQWAFENGSQGQSLAVSESFLHDDSHHETAMKNLTEDDDGDVSPHADSGMDVGGSGGTARGRGGRSTRGRRGGREGRGAREGRSSGRADRGPSKSTRSFGETALPATGAADGEAVAEEGTAGRGPFTGGRGSGRGRGRGSGRGRGYPVDSSQTGSTDDTGSAIAGPGFDGGRGGGRKPFGRGGGRGLPANPTRSRGPPSRAPVGPNSSKVE